MRGTLTGCLLLFVCAALLGAALPARDARAQENATTGASSPSAPSPEVEAAAAWGARKLDEFTRVGGCDHSARLDNLAIELQNNPELTAYVIAYGPAGEGSGTADFRLRVTENYLLSTRGFEPGRVRTVNGGAYRERGEAMVELWVVPQGAEPPRPRKFENDAATFNGMYSESETWDLSGQLGEALGPPTGNSKLAGFAEVLRLQPTALAYIVAFNGEESAFRAWQRVADREIEELKAYGVSADRVSVIFGGQAKMLRLQLWVLPPDAPPPAKEAPREKRPEAATLIGQYDALVLKYPEEARTFFKAFASALKADPELTAALTVYLPSPPETKPEGWADGPDTPPDVDFAQLVEKWKGDLAKEYGVGAQRLSVTFVPHEGDEWYSGSAVAWLVPPGITPPGPYEEDGGEGDAAQDEEAEAAGGGEAEPVGGGQGEATTPPPGS